jgi:ketosteroid isomerase-like protein
MPRHRTLIIETACAAWEAGNLEAVVADFADDVEFNVHAPAQSPSIIGGGRGRNELARRLGGYLGDIEVAYYEPLLPLTQVDAGILRCRAHFVYRHRRKSLEIEGTMRHLWHFAGDKVVRFEVFYDAAGMRAFYDLIETVAA